MNPARSEKETQKKKANVYFIIASVLLALMALLWSVDDAFIYIFLGAAAFFLFLGFYNRPVKTDYTSPHSAFQRADRQSAGQRSPDVFRALREIFYRQANSPQQKSRVIALAVAFFTFTFFFLIFLSVIFSDSETSSGTGDLFQKAEQFRWNGEYDSAAFYYRQVLSEDPDHMEALLGSGNNWLAKGAYDSAVAMFDRVLDADAYHDEARYGKAVGLHYKKSYRQSLNETLKIVQANPDHAEAVVLTGDNYYMQQRYDSAMYWYESAYEKGQRSAWLCHVMGYLYDTKGDQKKAIDLYKEALGYDSTRTDVYVRLGELFPGEEGEFYRNMARQLKEQGYQ